jgi:DNA polymerase III delta prime subunit
MKFLETHFEEYINSVEENNLHQKMENVYSRLPENIQDCPNLIFYGPSGIGKYSQMLYSIKKYSPSNLKYEKKMCVVYEKKQYFFKISDIHYEIDMSLLGCNSKNLWNEIYQQILDILSMKSNKTGIIVCREFHNIYSELLDNFYSYMQENNHLSVNIKFILLTEQISFIPDNILNCCEIIHLSRPSKTNYNKCLKNNKISNDVNLCDISNIKDLKVGIISLMVPHKIICNKIYDEMMNIEQLKFLKFRDILYDIFIYNLNISECIWYILFRLIRENKIKKNKISLILLKTFIFLRYYNNNYRPIYHLESYLFNLITYIYEY